VLFSFKTKFPVSNSCATGLTKLEETLVDQSKLLELVALSCKFDPLELMERTPVALTIGLSRFATHTIVCCVMFVYHMPKYWLLPAGKNPRVKTPPDETNVSSPLSEVFRDMVSVHVERENREKKDRRRGGRRWRGGHFFMAPKMVCGCNLQMLME
jgi:hypothetical protein